MPEGVHDAGIVEGDPVLAVALHKGAVQIVLVLIGEVSLLQRVPNDEVGNLLGQHRVVTGGKIFESRVGVQRFSPDGHDVGTVL